LIAVSAPLVGATVAITRTVVPSVASVVVTVPLVGATVHLRDLNKRQDAYPTITYTVSVTGAAPMVTAAPIAGAAAAAALFFI